MQEQEISDLLLQQLQGGSQKQQHVRDHTQGEQGSQIAGVLVSSLFAVSTYEHSS
jgi:hypothetical protein